MSNSTTTPASTVTGEPTGPLEYLRSAAEQPRLTFNPILALAAAVLLAASFNSRRLTKAQAKGWE